MSYGNILPRFMLTDQTTIGIPSTSLLTSIASDKAALSLNDPLYSWYMQALPMVSDPNTKNIYDTVIGVVNRNRSTHQRSKELSADIVKRMENLYQKSKSDEIQKTQVAKRLTDALGNSPIETTVVNRDPGVVAPGTNGTQGAPGNSDGDGKGATQGNPTQGAKRNGQGGGSNKFVELSNTWVEGDNQKADLAKKDMLRVNFENDPIISPDNAKITSTDRLIFIAMTFVLRAISIFLVEWAVNTYMVKSFEAAFKLYLICYVALFATWGIMVNASGSLFFRMLFYYIDYESHGIGRILVHFFVQLMLLPIPYIVRTKGFETAQEEYTYERRRKTMSILSNFTFFIWAITSIIALRY